MCGIVEGFCPIVQCFECMRVLKPAGGEPFSSWYLIGRMFFDEFGGLCCDV